MAVTAVLAFSRPNHMRYLLTQDGAAGTTVSITCSGAGTPDLRTDSVAGPIKDLANARLNGFGGVIPAAALTSQQVEMMWSSAQTVASGGIALSGPLAGRTAILQLMPFAGPVAAGTATGWLARPNVSGGNAVIDITAGAAAANAWLDIEIPGGIG